MYQRITTLRLESAPAIERCYQGVALLEEPNDLFVCEFDLPHVRHSRDWSTPATLDR